jgi:hypothetical protein
MPPSEVSSEILGRETTLLPGGDLCGRLGFVPLLRESLSRIEGPPILASQGPGESGGAATCHGRAPGAPPGRSFRWS